MRACDERDASGAACELNASAACGDPKVHVGFRVDRAALLRRFAPACAEEGVVRRVDLVPHLDQLDHALSGERLAGVTAPGALEERADSQIGTHDAVVVVAPVADERQVVESHAGIGARAAAAGQGDGALIVFELRASVETSQLLDDLHEAIAAAEGHPELKPALVALRRVWRSLQVIAAEVQQ